VRILLLASLAPSLLSHFQETVFRPKLHIDEGVRRWGQPGELVPPWPRRDCYRKVGVKSPEKRIKDK